MSKLYFYYSAMNAGKSNLLLQSSYNYNERGMKTILFTSYLDNRFNKNEISSRIGLSSPCLTYDNNTKLYKLIKYKYQKIDIDCIFIDESQFLTKTQVFDLCNIVDKLCIPVLCYGLRTDFMGNLFQGSYYLLAWADKLIEIKTICFCGKKAIMVLKIYNNQVIKKGKQIEIGDNTKYISVCRKHYNESLYKNKLIY